MKRRLGEEYQGGIIFYLNPDEESGLIVALENLGEATWNEAMDIARNYNGGGYSDWYLPSAFELDLLYQQKDIIGGFVDDLYWSSSEYWCNNAWNQSFSSGKHYYDYMSSINSFRPVRKF